MPAKPAADRRHPILTDKPAVADGLDFQPYIDALAQLMTDPNTSTPITVGVFGPWGSGKTSLMSLIKQQVDDKGYKSVWFNAWKYERDSLALWRVLILRTLDALRPRDKDGNLYPPDELGAKDRDLLKELDRLEQSVYRTVEWTELGQWTVNWAQALESTGEFAAEVALSLVPGGAPLVGGLRKLRDAIKGGGDVKPVVEAFQREAQTFRREQLRSIEQFITGFEEVVRQQVIGKNQRLVVFVDDLDRCLPERTVEVLEAIKLFLDAEGCIFVLGIDPPKVQQGIRLRYEGNLTEEEGADYLEKIIQLPFVLPTIDSGYMVNFVNSLQVDFPDARCARVFGEGLAPNPRQVKRAINIFLLLWKLAQARRLSDVTALRLAKVVVIQHSHAELFDLIKQMPRYLADLEIHFLRQADPRGAQQRGTGDGESEPPAKALPPDLEPFGERAALRTLFNLFADDTAASFRYLTPTDLRSYITLTRRAQQPERRAAAARRPFEPELVDVPATRFLMGSTHEEVAAGIAKENETPQHWLDLPAYRIGKYPVTNVQYAAFVQATNRTPPQHWEGNAAPPIDLSDHPVVWVGWQDAVAYCRWLSEQTGQTYRLPTEAEWERAASWAGEQGAGGRGVKRRYPWGDEFDPAKCNTEETGIGATTPVGQFSPAGDSPVGCADMGGNVWEWCSTKDGVKYPFQVKDEWAEEYLEKNELRVLRGGSFYFDKNAARASFRSWYGRSSGPDRDLGFRVVCAAAPSSLASEPSGL
ncbi:MAG: hypothetical protein Kow0031_35150 [Anaerolineae bacterium]